MFKYVGHNESLSMERSSSRSLCRSVADAGGSSCPPQTAVAPLKMAIKFSDKIAPPSGVYRSRKNIAQSKLNNALHFVELQYLREGL